MRETAGAARVPHAIALFLGGSPIMRQTSRHANPKQSSVPNDHRATHEQLGLGLNGTRRPRLANRDGAANLAVAVRQGPKQRLLGFHLPVVERHALHLGYRLKPALELTAIGVGG